MMIGMELRLVTKTDANNPDLGDLYLDEEGHEVLTTDLGIEVAQRLWTRLNFGLGEWFLDTSEGTPWFDHILTKGPNDQVVRTVLNSVIRNTEGVSALLRLNYAVGRDRLMTINFEAQLADGSTFRTADYGQFFVDLSTPA
jgi:hypothetical protein